ncbi:hypothetical protein ACQR35_11285 [Pseudarthrobacter sp. J1738]|uniref:hypothetical protein n=1 Tax=unclassified Pseudarthrobacter TaxID=2647000 RepID=UPI003D26F8F8
MTSLSYYSTENVRKAVQQLQTPGRFFTAYALTLLVLLALMVGAGSLGQFTLSLGITAVVALLFAELLLTVAFAAVAILAPLYWARRHRA